MWPRKTIDIGYADLFRGLGYSALVRQKDNDRLDSDDANFVCLSVRSGFDTLLGSVNFDPGSEILFSELNIPDMERITRANGFVPVSAPLNDANWSIDAKAIEANLTPRTKMIVVSHLFGRRECLREISAIAQRHNILLIQDCAQSFRHPRDFGDTAADISMYSFGPIKTCSCLGGAILRINNPALATSFATAHHQLSCQSNIEFAKRIGKYIFLKTFEHPFIFKLFYRSIKKFGRDPDAFIANLARGFSKSDFFEQIRRRPSAGLKALLAHRLENYDFDMLHHRAELGHQLSDLLSPSIPLPGYSGHASDHYWVFPILSRNPTELVRRLLDHGFDATQRNSLSVVGNSKSTQTPGNEFLQQVVFLPLDNRMDKQTLRLLARIVNDHENTLESDESLTNKTTSRQRVPAR